MRIWQGQVAEGLERIRVAFAESGLPLEESVAALPSMQSVELLALVAPRVAAALACWLTGEVALARQVAEDALAFARERAVPQAVAVVAVTFAVMAQLDGDRDTVVRLCREAWDLSDEVSTRQWRQWARSLLVVGRRGRRGARGVRARCCGPTSSSRWPTTERGTGAGLRAAGRRRPRRWPPRVSGSANPPFCACARPCPCVSGRGAAAADDYAAAAPSPTRRAPACWSCAALAEWAQLDGSPPHVRRDLEALVGELAAAGPSLSLDAARAAAGECRDIPRLRRRVPRQPPRRGGSSRRTESWRACSTAPATPRPPSVPSSCTSGSRSDPKLAEYLARRVEPPEWAEPEGVAKGQELLRPLGRPRVHRALRRRPALRLRLLRAACRSSA